MDKGVIWGAGGTGSHVYDMYKDTVDILCFVDSDETKWGKVRGGKNLRA